MGKVTKKTKVKSTVAVKPPTQPPKSSRLWRRRGFWLGLTLVVVAAVAIGVVYDDGHHLGRVSDILPSLASVSHKAVGGKIVSAEVIRSYSGDEVNALAKQNYGNDGLPAKNPISELLVKYTSIDTAAQQIDEYARVYLPRVSPDSKIPVLTLAPGTTGIGDQCAASLEQPALANWANYQSHAAAYAGQGFAVVIPDYEGMRDSTRIHHYMVGIDEGRAVLDATKATYALKDYPNLDPSQLFLAGYSQGGHAIAWADQLAPSYAPGLKIKGLVAFAPVSDITVTLSDITRGSSLSWFGPYLLVSYADLYSQTFNLATILQPKYSANLHNDVLSHCVNSVKYWGPPNQVYTPQFLAALNDNSLLETNYPDLARDIAQNQPWQVPTATPKLINQGDKDNVILPDQQAKVLPAICKAAEPVQVTHYPDATHYTVMVKSFKDTLEWMAKVSTGQALPSSCPPAIVQPSAPTPTQGGI